MYHNPLNLITKIEYDLSDTVPSPLVDENLRVGVWCEDWCGVDQRTHNSWFHHNSEVSITRTILVDSAKKGTPPLSSTKSAVINHPREIIQMVCKRRAVRHTWQKSRNPANEAWFVRLRKITNDMIAKCDKKSLNLIYSRPLIRLIRYSTLIVSYFSSQ